MCDDSPLSYFAIFYPDFTPSNTTIEKITAIIKSLKDCSPGCDNIHTKVIKKGVSVLAPVISSNINKSFAKGIFPVALKIAKIILIHKGGKKDVVSNYRPISLLPSISKIYERAMYNRLIEFSIQHNILSDDQYGFRKNRSPKLAILKLIGLILENFGEEKFVISVFLDSKKAFDTLEFRP